MDEVKRFEAERSERIARQGENQALADAVRPFLLESIASGYSYNFHWMGRPIIQYPQDIMAMQEIIWEVKPDLIIETGIAHGGTVLFYASMMKLLENDGRVVSIDIDIREHNRREIEDHPMFQNVTMIEGSSLDPDVRDQVYDLARGSQCVLLALDSNHTHQHALQEMQLYGPLVTKGSYMVVFDTVIEDLPPEASSDRPWGPGDNPKTAVHEFLRKNNDFEIDQAIQNKLLLTVAPDGYLRRVRD